MLNTIPGAVNSNSYASVTNADAYFTARATDAWLDLDLAQKETALIKATAYMEAFYRWAGHRVTTIQSLSWPRYGVYTDGVYVDAATIPLVVINACCELALKASSGELVTDLDPLLIVEQTVDVITTKYSERRGSQVKYSYVDMMLGPVLLYSGANGFRMVRA